MASANTNTAELADKDRDKGVVLIAVDHSEISEFAFEWYVENGYKDDLGIVLLHCPEVESLTKAPILLSGLEFLQEAIREERIRVKRLEEKYREKLKQRGLEGQFQTAEGKPGEAIVQAAKATNAKLIVIGSRGSGKIRRTLLGSISDYVLSHSHVTVLVCRNKRHLLDHLMQRQLSAEEGLRKRSFKDRLLRKYHSVDETNKTKDSNKNRDRQPSDNEAP